MARRADRRPAIAAPATRASDFDVRSSFCLYRQLSSPDRAHQEGRHAALIVLRCCRFGCGAAGTCASQKRFLRMRRPELYLDYATECCRRHRSTQVSGRGNGADMPLSHSLSSTRGAGSEDVNEGKSADAEVSHFQRLPDTMIYGRGTLFVSISNTEEDEA
jgi:hypothetical protein